MELGINMINKTLKIITRPHLLTVSIVTAWLCLLFNIALRIYYLWMRITTWWVLMKLTSLFCRRPCRELNHKLRNVCLLYVSRCKLTLGCFQLRGIPLRIPHSPIHLSCFPVALFMYHVFLFRLCKEIAASTMNGLWVCKSLTKATYCK